MSSNASTKTTTAEVVAVSDWAKSCGNLAESFYKGYPLVDGGNTGVTPASILGNLRLTAIQKGIEKKDALRMVNLQKEYYYKNKDNMLKLVEKYDQKYSKFSPENHPSSWLGRKLVGIEVELGKVLNMLK